MAEVTAWGTGWSNATGVLRDPMSEESARARFDADLQFAAETLLANGGRALVLHCPGSHYLRVDLHGWPEGAVGRASLHYQLAFGGGYEICQVGVTRGPEFGAAWVQRVNLHEALRHAVLDIPGDMVRHELDLGGSDAHAQVAALRFPVPSFGQYGDFVRPDLIERCLVDLKEFDPGLESLSEGRAAAP